ncbi:MAG: THUMP-like domain-containing protein [Nocardioidaceae bacterium]
MDLSNLEFLLTAPGQRLLGEATASYDACSSHEATLSAATRLRGSYEPQHVSAAMTQVQLRHKARTKFGPDADRLYLTPVGLEQATHRLLADHRAERIATTGIRTVLDLACGIGADLLALARRNLEVVGIDRDALAARCAGANLSALGLPGRAVVGDALAFDRSGVDLVFVDPARRGAAGRVFDPHSFSPPWSFVEQLLAGDAVAKLAPGLPHALIPAAVEAEWVSLDGQLREAVLWSGRTAVHHRRATVLTGAGERFEITDAGKSKEPSPDVRAVGEVLYEPDDAVIRAHLVGSFAALCNGWLLDPHLAYVSADDLHLTGLAKVYRVLERLPFKEKALRAALRARDIGSLTIKKRGVMLTPEALRRKLGLRGSRSATLVVSRTPRSAVALLVEKVENRPLQGSDSAGQ